MPEPNPELPVEPVERTSVQPEAESPLAQPHVTERTAEPRVNERPDEPLVADEAPRRAPPSRAWGIGTLAFLALIAASIVSIGLAAVVWVPLLFGIGVAMIAVASSRRRRQLSQGRNADEVRDPRHARPRWPSNVIDDRLPET